MEGFTMKVIVIGCTHAGTAAVNQIYATDPDTQVTVYERNDNTSFLSCGIALYLGGEVKDPQGLFYSSPETLAKLGANVKMFHFQLCEKIVCHALHRIEQKLQHRKSDYKKNGEILAKPSQCQLKFVYNISWLQLAALSIVQVLL